MSPQRAHRLRSRDEPMFPRDPVEKGHARANRRAIGRAFVGLLVFGCIWASVFASHWILDIQVRHAAFVGLIASIAYAVYRERRNRRTAHDTRVERRRRWRRPIARAPDRAARAPALGAVPRKRRSLSRFALPDLVLWGLVIGMVLTAIGIALQF